MTTGRWLLSVNHFNVAFYLARVKDTDTNTIALTRDHKKALGFATHEDAQAFKEMQSAMRIGMNERHVNAVFKPSDFADFVINQQRPATNSLDRAVALLKQASATNTLPSALQEAVVDFLVYPKRSAFAKAHYEHDVHHDITKHVYEQAAKQGKTVAPAVTTYNVVRFCPERDLECGDNPANWCVSCTLRKPQPGQEDGLDGVNHCLA